MDRANPVLAQIVGRAAPATPADDESAQLATPARQLRRAFGRAADTALGMSMSVLGIAEEIAESEELIETGLGPLHPDGQSTADDDADTEVVLKPCVVLGLRKKNKPGLAGLVLMDEMYRSAIVEVQTMGRLLPVPANQRPITRTDTVLCQGFVEELFRQLVDAGFGAGAVMIGELELAPIQDLRTAGLVLVQAEYRTWRVTVQLGTDDVQGEIMFALPPIETHAPAASADIPNWSEHLRKAVVEAPADLDAILARLKFPLREVEGFEVGQVLNLPGITVGSVVVTAAGGQAVGQARLGQVAGKRAVRIQTTDIEMHDAEPVAAGPAGAPTPIAGGGDLGAGALGSDMAMASMADIDVAADPASAEEPSFGAPEMIEPQVAGEMMLETGDESVATADEALDPAPDFAVAPMAAPDFAPDPMESPEGDFDFSPTPAGSSD